METARSNRKSHFADGRTRRSARWSTSTTTCSQRPTKNRQEGCTFLPGFSGSGEDLLFRRSSAERSFLAAADGNGVLLSAEADFRNGWSAGAAINYRRIVRGCVLQFDNAGRGLGNHFLALHHGQFNVRSRTFPAKLVVACGKLLPVDLHGLGYVQRTLVGSKCAGGEQYCEAEYHDLYPTVRLHKHLFFPGLSRDQGRLVRCPKQGLPFRDKSLQCGCVGDTKGCGPRTRTLFDRAWLTWAAKPSVNRSRHPAKNLFVTRRGVTSPHPGSVRLKIRFPN